MNIILLGLPGAGKGTQAAKIIEDFNTPHISTGDMFRAAIKNGTALGIEAKSYMDKGALVPDDVTNGIVNERLQAEDVEEHGFLLDGFPRTLVQAEALDNILKENNMPLDAVLYIEVDEDILMERLTGRYICSNCGATYHKIFNPTKVEGVCDRCGETEFYQRDDDKPETVKNRLEVNSKQTEDLLDYYSERGVILKVDGTGTPEEVYSEVKAQLETL